MERSHYSQCHGRGTDFIFFFLRKKGHNGAQFFPSRMKNRKRLLPAWPHLQGGCEVKGCGVKVGVVSWKDVLCGEEERHVSVLAATGAACFRSESRQTGAVGANVVPRNSTVWLRWRCKKSLNILRTTADRLPPLHYLDCPSP